MKTITLIFILISFSVKAQFPPNLLSPYESPLIYNSKLDSTFVPGKAYRIDKYTYNNYSHKLELGNYYIVETDDYLITKYTDYPINVTGQGSPNGIEKNIYRYSYQQNKLKTITYNFLGNDSANETFSWIDSFNYNNSFLYTFSSWGPYEYKIVELVYHLYKYDSLSRFIGIDGFDKHFRIDSFTLNNLPSKVVSYPNGGTSFYNYIYCYDSLLRPNYIILQNTDSFKFFYSSNRNFPDSILDYNVQSFNSLNGKTIFSYASNGKISEIDYYDGSYMISHKEVYSLVNNVGLQAINSTDNSINIFPNPATDKLFIQSQKEKVLSYKIIDMQGKILADEKFNSESIQLNGFSNGILVVQLKLSGGTTISKRILKIE